MAYKDKQKQREYQKRWIQKRRTDYLINKCCVQCSSVDNLRIDHIDPVLKTDHRIWSWSEDRRLKELNKCQVLCQECHRIKTRADMGWVEHGTGSYSQGCRCGKCLQAKSAYNRQYYLKNKNNTE
jgi:hypothetical protein